MSNKAKPRKAVKAVPPLPPEAPAEEQPSGETPQQVRGVKPQSVINALQRSLDEKAQQIRMLEDRNVLLQAVIAEQDEEIAELRQKPARRKG